jgi:glycogen synthase
MPRNPASLELPLQALISSIWCTIWKVILLSYEPKVGYEGKIYLDDDDYSYVHQLARDMVYDPHSRQACINSSRTALLSSDQWGTVSESYRNDLMRVSPLSGLLCSFPAPFAKLNGIKLSERLVALSKVAKDHETAKAMIQKKYFGEVDPSIPVYAFVGRIVLQKGVHLVLNAVRELMDVTRGKFGLRSWRILFENFHQRSSKSRERNQTIFQK